MKWFHIEDIRTHEDMWERHLLVTLALQTVTTMQGPHTAQLWGDLLSFIYQTLSKSSREVGPLYNHIYITIYTYIYIYVYIAVIFYSQKYFKLTRSWKLKFSKMIILWRLWVARTSGIVTVEISSKQIWVHSMQAEDQASSWSSELKSWNEKDT